MSLRELVDATPWIDTHEHLVEEHGRLAPGGHTFTLWTGDSFTIRPDWSAVVIGGYGLADLVCAGLAPEAARRLIGGEQSSAEKWDEVEPFLADARMTGYLRAIDISFARLCGLRLSRETFEEIDRRLAALRVEGFYRHVLRDVANVTQCHVHTPEHDPFCETRSPELLAQDFALWPLASGRHAAVEAACGIDVGTLDDYLRVIDWCFERYAGRAVAAKIVWAYSRPLAMEVPATPPAREFERLRAGEADADEQRRVEDFLMQRCVELATDAGLPVKIHLGYLAETGNPLFRHVYDHVRDVVPLVQANPATTFVLMHIGWPQQEQLLALAKHHPNVVLDLCWAWIVGPIATQQFLERALTTIPANKLLCFGGDHFTVENVVGHAELARRGLQAALESLVERGWIGHADALALVPRLMHGNAERIFDH